MESLGEYLQRHRKVSGYSLEDVARITRINPHYLKAIEENDYEKLPAPAFTMGFLRSYARLLSLDESDVVHRFQQSLPPPPRKGTVSQPPAEKDSWGRILESIPAKIQMDIRFKKKTPLLAGVLGGIVLVVVLFMVFWPSGRKEVPAPTSLQELPPPQEAEFPPPPLQEPSPVPVPEEAAPSPAPVAPAVVPAAPEGEKLILAYEAREETWVSVVIDGGEVRSALLAPGERVEWTARERFLLTLGNAGGGNLFLNRRPLGTLGESGQVLRGIRITREGAALPSVIPETADPSNAR